jgi:hypothetical protein
VFAKQPASQLRGFVVWVPMLGATEADVPVASRLVPDPRAQHYWDQSGRTMEVFRQPLGLQGEAWDVYLLYGRGVRWEGEVPPAPDFWMHQLSGAAGPVLDPEVLARRASDLLGRK